MNQESTTNRISRLIVPDALKKNEPQKWSPGIGTDIWSLFCASMTGDLQTIKLLVDKDPALVRSSYEYRNAMTFAVQENQLEVATFLIQRGADPVNAGTPDSLLNIATDRGHNAMAQLLKKAISGSGNGMEQGEVIAEAIRSRDLNTVRSLLETSSGYVHATDQSSNQPIHWAVMTRQPDMIDLLLAHGADINAKRFDGASCVQLVNGDYNFRGWSKDFPVTPRQTLQHLRTRGAYIDICTASAIGDIERVRQLLNEDPSLANRVSDYVTYYIGSGAPIKNAASCGHIEIVRLLLDYGADPNLPEEGIAPDGHALHSAVCNGHIEIVKLLLKHGAYPNVEIESSADTLSAAIANNDQPMIELLCSYGAARNVRLLAYYGDISTAAAVFAANTSKANDTGALENAAGQGHESFVRLMIKYCPTLPQRIAVGVSSRSPGAGAKTKAIADLLFEHGMNASLPNWLRITPLHRFAQKGDMENAELFIMRGADINAIDEELSSTPLGWAAKYGQLAMIDLLLKHGADRNLPLNNLWATPLAWARRRGHEQIAALLEITKI